MSGKLETYYVDGPGVVRSRSMLDSDELDATEIVRRLNNQMFSLGRLQGQVVALDEAGEALADLTAAMLECLADEFGTDHGMPVGFDKKRVLAVNAWLEARDAD